MSQVNVEIVRRFYEAFNHGDIVGAFTEFLAPDIVYFEREAYLDTPAVVRGRQACVKAMSDFASTFEEFRADIEEIADAGDWVTTLTHWRGSGAGSGASVDLREVIGWRFQDGLVIEGRVFASWEEGLETVGLSEQDAHADS
jgi:ketosteroid isomerase-like protein